MFLFSPPAVKKRLKFNEIITENLEKSSENILQNFPVHSVHLLIPSANAYKEKYEEILSSEESTYFLLKNVPATCFIQKTFLECFVKSGLLLCVTTDASIEVDNFLSIVPPGKLILSLERSVSQTLVLQKEKCHKKGKRFFQTIIIDLTWPELFPGKKHFEFISAELLKIDHIRFNLLMKWKPDGNICPQSLKTYFTSQGYECIACKPKHKYSSKFSAAVPKINFEKKTCDVLNNTLEWIGMEICGLQYANEDDEFISKLTLPDDFETVTKLYKSSFEGLYTKDEVLHVIQELSKVFDSNPTLTYIVAVINGFQDGYVQANGFQFFSSDDKLICILIFPSSKYWFISLNCR